ncbi:MAG TPA: ABC transporter permease subunit [Candidatus Thioglobus sp.]|nr:ABC transporter permease subunit [Candidatus Thioglobus sp.]
MAVRPIPKQSILDCLPTAAEIGDLRIVNKDLNFIQAMTKRADDLTSQALSATDYTQLVKITDNYTKLADRASVKAKTLKELSNESNPLTEVNSAAELLEKVQLLSQVLENKTQELGAQFNSNATTQYEAYNNSVAELSSRVDSINSPNQFTSIFKDIEPLLKDIEENSRYLVSNDNASELVNKVELLAQQYADKADTYSTLFMSDIGLQIGSLHEKIRGLIGQVDSLNSNIEIQSHIEQISQIRDKINSLASTYKSFSGSKDMIFSLDELSITTHAKVQDMVDSNEIVSNLMPLVNDPEALSRAVKEASIRTDVSSVENVLMPLVNKTNELGAKVIDLAAQYEAGNYAEIKVGVIANLDKVVQRLDRTYMSVRSTDPEALSATISKLSQNIETQFESAQSVDPVTQGDYFATLSTQVSDAINVSDFSLFVNNAISIPRDVMMNSRMCVDSAFRDFTREFGDIIEKIFDPLLFFLARFEQLLLATPWPVFLLGAGALAWLGSRSLKVTVGVILGFFAIGFLDMWAPMISTVTMIATATLLCLTIGIPLGIWMSRSDRAQLMITPVLDIMQTIPSFVYLIPVVMLLGIGKVPGLIAVCIYAMPPIVRLTNLGLRLVDKEAMEAADAFGATYRQRLFMVQIPLALPNIFAGVNQTIMMALSMVVIASMIGVTGLGLPVLQAVQNQYLSLGMLYGLAIVALAIIFDRVSQAFGTRIQKHRSGDVL